MINANPAASKEWSNPPGTLFEGNSQYAMDKGAEVVPSAP